MQLTWLLGGSWNAPDIDLLEEAVRERLGHVAGSLAAVAPGIRDGLPGSLQWTPG